MTTVEPSGQNVSSPKIRDQALVRKFIAQNGTGYTAISITTGDSYVDPDADTLALAVYFDDVTAEFPTEPGTQVVNATSGQITRAAQGQYYYNLGPALTANRGVLTIVWTYQVGGASFTYRDHAQILNQMPLYQMLRDPERCVVEQVSWMLGDLFDSTDGGPNLIEPFQTHFDYERVAQMQKNCVEIRLNHIGFPVTNYGVGPNTEQVHPHLQSMVVMGTYLECVRHLVRSYTEIPVFQGANVTFADRRDYQQRWNEIFTQEWPEYVTYVKMAKRKLLNLGRGALLVGGGIYGGSAMGIFQAGTYASQVRSWRFYPAAPAISWGSTNHA